MQLPFIQRPHPLTRRVLLAVLASLAALALSGPSPTAAGPVPPPIRVHGGGWFAVPGGQATFGFEVLQERSGPTPPPIRGTLEYTDHSSGLRLHSTAVHTLLIEGNTARFSGTVRVNEVLQTFAVNVTEGEAGRGGSFALTTGDYFSSGVLQGGSIRILKPSPPPIYE